MSKSWVLYVDGKKMAEIPFRNKKDVNRMKNKAGVKIEIIDNETGEVGLFYKSKSYEGE
ncbi:hypothetical protein KAR91_49495 [Candidatus Pacearchaeota archaeon]|nr:hypothetical protein [Candidatus Pacearchaeota archaeon]